MQNITIARQFADVRQKIVSAASAAGRSADSVKLVVVTKTHPVESIQAVIDAGATDLGENRVQEIEEKVPHLRGAYSMHCIGHLQTNKVNKVVPIVEWIESIDSSRLAAKVDAAAAAIGKKIKVLVQVNTSAEESKSGCMPQDCIAICEELARFKALDLRGLMTMGPLNGTEQTTRRSFALLRQLGEQCRNLVSGPFELSMGMSSDFVWAIAEGSTMVRIGSAILGSR